MFKLEKNQKQVIKTILGIVITFTLIDGIKNIFAISPEQQMLNEVSLETEEFSYKMCKLDRLNKECYSEEEIEAYKSEQLQKTIKSIEKNLE